MTREWAIHKQKHLQDEHNTAVLKETEPLPTDAWCVNLHNEKMQQTYLVILYSSTMWKN